LHSKQHVHFASAVAKTEENIMSIAFPDDDVARNIFGYGKIFVFPTLGLLLSIPGHNLVFKAHHR
jgi:hypothetical protein